MWESQSGRCPTCRQAASVLKSSLALFEEGPQHYVLEEYEQCLEKMKEVLSLDEDHNEANVLAGELYLEGLGVPTDLELAKDYFQKARSGGDVVAMYNLGILYDCSCLELVEAQKYYLEAHDKGHLQATFNLGVMHHNRGESDQAQEVLL